MFLFGFFNHNTDYETKSILAQLAGIIMELVGEPNVFSLWFKVKPEVGMAIRRNKLRISPVLRHGLVLSFCVHSMPEQFVNNDEDDSAYGSPYGHDAYYRQSSYSKNLQVMHTMDDSLNDIDNGLGLDWENIIHSSGNTPMTPASPRSPSPSPKDLPEDDFGFQSTSDDEDDTKGAENDDNEEKKLDINERKQEAEDDDDDDDDMVYIGDNMGMVDTQREKQIDSDGSNGSNGSNNTSRVYYQSYQSSDGGGSPSASSRRKSKSKSGNKLSPSSFYGDDIENDDGLIGLNVSKSAPYGLLQSITKTSDTPSSTSPRGTVNDNNNNNNTTQRKQDAIISINANHEKKAKEEDEQEEEHVVEIQHRKFDSNTDVELWNMTHGNQHSQPFDNVVLLRNEKHLKEDSDSFNGPFDITSPPFINENTFTFNDEISFNTSRTYPSHDKSQRSLSTNISVSDTTISHQTNASLIMRDKDTSMYATNNNENSLIEDVETDNYNYNPHSSGSVNESGMVYFNEVYADDIKQNDHNTKYPQKQQQYDKSLYLYDLPSSEDVINNPAQSTLKLKQDTRTPFSSAEDLHARSPKIHHHGQRDLIVNRVQLNHLPNITMQDEESNPGTYIPEFGYPSISTNFGSSNGTRKSNPYLSGPEIEDEKSLSFFAENVPVATGIISNSAPIAKQELEIKSRGSMKIPNDEDIIQFKGNKSNSPNDSDTDDDKEADDTQESLEKCFMMQQSITSRTPSKAAKVSDSEDCNGSANGYPQHSVLSKYASETSQCSEDPDPSPIPYSDYASVEEEDNDTYSGDDKPHFNMNARSKFNKIRQKIEESGQLQLTNGSSANSIPLGTIQVTTPGNKHTQVIWNKDNKKRNNKNQKYTIDPLDLGSARHKDDENLVTIARQLSSSLKEDLSPIKDGMNEDLKELDTPVISPNGQQLAQKNNDDDIKFNIIETQSRPRINSMDVMDEEIKINTADLDLDHIENMVNFPYYRRSGSNSNSRSFVDTDSDLEDNYNNSKKSKSSKTISSGNKRKMPVLRRTNSQKRPPLNYVSKSNHFKTSYGSNNSNRIISTTPKFARPVLRSDRTKQKKKGHRPRSQTCIDNGLFNDLFVEPDLYESIIIDNGSNFLSQNVSMLSTEKFGLNNNNKKKPGNILKFQKPFDKMVADEYGNIFIGTDKYIRYVTYNKDESDNYNYNKKDKSSKSSKYRKFRQQEKLLYELKLDEHLVCLWNQDGKIYFTTMKYALQDYRESYDNNHSQTGQEWQLHLYIVENNNVRHTSMRNKFWIPPSTKDKLPYRKLKTFHWKIKGKTIENFLSMWYDEKYDTLITLAECDRQTQPQLIFLNKRNNRGLIKLKIRNNTFSMYGSDDMHQDGCNNQLLIRHKPTKSWLCCISCIDKNDEKDDEKKNDDIRNEECWIQFKLNRENNKIISSKIIKLPEELQQKKWLCYDKHRDCLIGIKRLEIEQLLELGFETKIELFVIPRLTKLLQLNASNEILNEERDKIKTKMKNNKHNKRNSSNINKSRSRSHSQRRRTYRK